VNCISPDSIATDILYVHPQECKEKWFSIMPANRLCDAAELRSAYVFLASDVSTHTIESPSIALTLYMLIKSCSEDKVFH
jgi:hypothetical protein